LPTFLEHMSKCEVAINVRNGMAVGVCLTPYIKKKVKEYDVTSGVFSLP